MSLLNHGLQPCISEYNQTAQNKVTAQYSGPQEASWQEKAVEKRAKVRGNPGKAQFPSSLAEIVSETVRIWRKHHLGYDQTKYVVEQARRRLKLRPLAARRRTVDRLDKSEIERLIRSTYQSHNKYGLMIKTLFLIGARVDEFAHIRIEDLHLDGDPPQIYLSHCKKESNRYVPLLPALAQELRTHLNGRCQGYPSPFAAWTFADESLAEVCPREGTPKNINRLAPASANTHRGIDISKQ
jgi:integrase